MDTGLLVSFLQGQKMYLETKIASVLFGLVLGLSSFGLTYKDIIKEEVLHIIPEKVITVDAITTQTSNYDERLKCMTEVIYYEAGGESFEGKTAVAQVVLNRTQHGAFPNDVCDVIYQKTMHRGKILCQFSWLCEHRRRSIDEAMWRESKYIANLALTMNVINVNIAIHNAIFFHSTSVRPGWKYNKVNQIGNHIFYASL